MLTSVQEDDSTGYFGVVVVRCDSGLKTIDDLKGKTLAFADPDSTSGYNVPYYNLVQQGYVPETFFSAIPFSGSHEAGVAGVANASSMPPRPISTTKRTASRSGWKPRV